MHNDADGENMVQVVALEAFLKPFHVLDVLNTIHMVQRLLYVK